ncbi:MULTISPECIES: DUF5348 domain-containing protein [Gracilibacillus]|uniref:DUF5348 domain-containing protein n=1 Tax=Gracilibacillus TaxID=74385 RepID=UPI0008272039|nr:MULTISPECIES: DUF5348 domain-containing protein [Gracilibacillus]
MMRQGIMIFDLQGWKIWIGQQDYETFEGMAFELRIQKHYFKAYLGKEDQEWYVILDEDVAFNLRVFEVYKVRIEYIDITSGNAS